MVRAHECLEFEDVARSVYVKMLVNPDAITHNLHDNFAFACIFHGFGIGSELLVPSSFRGSGVAA